jgi:hypothetical protein
MLKSRSQTASLLFILVALLGLYSFIRQRLNSTAEKLRLEHEYLSWDGYPTVDEITCQHLGLNDSSFVTDPVPPTVHFILLADQDKQAELEFYQHLAIKAVLLRLGPVSVKLHSYSLNQDNVWWRPIKHRVMLVTHEPRPTLRTTDGHLHKLRLAHQSDILRLEILHEEGGIYLDIDVYALQSFHQLMGSTKDLVMGHEGGNRSGIGNAVIVARPRSPFIGRWLATYEESFDNRPQMWNHHSVKVPAKMAERYPENICKLSPGAFFWPTWSSEHIDMMQLPISKQEAMELKSDISRYGGAMYKDQLAYHAWGNIARAKFLSKLTPERLFSIESRFNILLRDIFLVKV